MGELTEERVREIAREEIESFLRSRLLITQMPSQNVEKTEEDN